MGTQVLDCVLLNRHFSVAVDRTSDVLVVTDTADGAVLAIVSGEEVYLGGSLFADGAVGAAWLHAPANVDGAAAEALERSVGGAMAGYLFAAGLPPNAVETAAASLEVARWVSREPPQDGDKTGGSRFSIQLDPQRLNERAARSGSGREPPVAGSELGAPTVDVWLDAEGRVVRIAVTVGAGSGESGPGGWALEYAPLERGLDGAAPSDVVDIADVDLSRLRGRAEACRLGEAGR
ncbi:MAG: hypothetical protein GEV08_13385 [Acidimicrobiia bacterium]|nr:hypothetical protein [Acidimicrobiia bacterium]